jgi:hypothetical protein
MKHLFSCILVVLLALVVRDARALVQLTAPVQISASYVWANSLNCQVPPNDLQSVQCTIGYVYTDGSGNLVTGFRGGTSGILQPADIVALLSLPASGPNNFRNRIQVALMSNLGSAAAGTPQ